MRYLRTNTATRVTVGPFFGTDGLTPKTSLTVTNCKLTFMVDSSNVPTLVLDTNPTASGGSNDMVHVTGDDAGFYDLELAAADTNYLGRAMLALTDATNHCPVFHEFMILPAMIYDSLMLGTDDLDTNTKKWNDLTTVSLPLVPTTAGRTLDVSTGGEAGVDWANVGSPTTSNALTGTTIATTQKVDIETIKTNPVVNAGTVTFPTTATLASTTNITAGTITTVTTVTNQLTAAQIATGVWQDTTSGDFTVASSIGKSLFTSGAVPGAAGGHFIAGSNAATTMASFTITAAPYATAQELSLRNPHKTYYKAPTAIGALQLLFPTVTTFNLIARESGTASGTEGNGAKTLTVVQGSSESAVYNTGTDTLTVTINISGGHNTVQHLVNVINAGTDFIAYGSSDTDLAKTITTSTVFHPAHKTLAGGAGDDTNPGTRDLPFKTFTAAEAAGNKLDDICMMAGYHADPIAHSKPSAVKGEGHDDTLLIGLGTMATAGAVDGTSFYGLLIDSLDGLAVNIGTCNNVTVENCSILGVTGGVYLENCVDCKIKGNGFTVSAGPGIDVNSGRGVDIINNNLALPDADTNTTATLTAIVLRDGTSATVRGGTIDYQRAANTGANAKTVGISLSNGDTADCAVSIENVAIAVSSTGASAAGAVRGITSYDGTAYSLVDNGSSITTSHTADATKAKDIDASVSGTRVVLLGTKYDSAKLVTGSAANIFDADIRLGVPAGASIAADIAAGGGAADWTGTEKAQILAALSVPSDIGVPKNLTWVIGRFDGTVKARAAIVKAPTESVDVFADFRNMLANGDAVQSITSIALINDAGAETISSTAFSDVSQATVWMAAGARFHISGGTAGDTDRIMVTVHTVGGQDYAAPCTVNVSSP